MHTIGLVQINNSFSGHSYFPYSVGLLKEYSKKYCIKKDTLIFSDIIYNRVPVKSAIETLKNCSIVGFSVYVWNVKLSLKIASELKKINPSCFIIFGGPQVPDIPDEFMNTHRFIDMTVHGEGEVVFSQILDNFETKTFDSIDSISYYENNVLIKKPRAARIKDMEKLVSPYSSGAFDELMINNPNEKWLVLWETNRGCPFSCTFCDWGSSVATKVNQFGLDRLKKEIDWFCEKEIEFIFCCDANYGILPRDLDITEYIVNKKLETGYPKALSVQNTKNATERAYKVQKMLSDNGLNKGVTISMQSMDKQTLKNINRSNISVDSFQELQRRFNKDRVETYSDMILGLPGETYDSFLTGIDLIINNGQHNRIQFNNLSILPNAEIGNKQYQKKYNIQCVSSKIINIHGSLDEIDDDSIQELQELVIATDSTPKTEWVKMRAYCWMVALLHFNKILQIPLIVIKNTTDISYRMMFEFFMDEKNLHNYPILNDIRQFFINKAIDIQNGGEEYCESKEFLNIWWPADELVFINLVKNNKIDEFYVQAHNALIDIININNKSIDDIMLLEALTLNKKLIRLPFNNVSETYSTSYNIYEFYKSIVIGDIMALNNEHHNYYIDKSSSIYSWDEWFREVVWYGNKKGAYLYGNISEKQYEGHL